MNDHSDHSEGPVWARKKSGGGGGGNPLVSFLVTLLALFGALTAVLAVKERSVAEGGAIVDGWIHSAMQQVRGASGHADEAAADATQDAAHATRQAGHAVAEGARDATEAATH